MWKSEDTEQNVAAYSHAVTPVQIITLRCGVSQCCCISSQRLFLSLLPVTLRCIPVLLYLFSTPILVRVACYTAVYSSAVVSLNDSYSCSCCLLHCGVSQCCRISSQRLFLSLLPVTLRCIPVLLYLFTTPILVRVACYTAVYPSAVVSLNDTYSCPCCLLQGDLSC